MTVATLRLALTLPGGASLGTYEAGAVAALVAVVQRINEEQPGTVEIDAIAGASAGALTSVLTARALLAGDDPVRLLRRAWVDAPSLAALRARGPWAPLSLRRARTVAHTLLTAEAPSNGAPRQRAPVTLDIALSCLRGFSHEIPRSPSANGDNRPAVPTTSYLDWGYHELYPLEPGRAPQNVRAKEWAHATATALASASHPLAFAPTRLDRKALRAEYEKHGIKLSARSMSLWYTDGGLLDNEPLGRCLDRIPDEEDAERLVLIVRANAHMPPAEGDPAWSDGFVPRWTGTLMRSLDVLAAHHASADLLAAEKVNTRIVWTTRLADQLAKLLVDTPVKTLEGLLEEIDGKKEILRVAKMQAVKAAGDDGSQAESHAPAQKPEDDDEEYRHYLVERLLLAATGLDRKRFVEIEVVSNEEPAAFAGEAVRRQLGALLERRRREYDFAAGYARMLKWAAGDPRGLTRYVDADLLRGAVRAARVAGPDVPRRRRARRRLGHASIAGRWRVVRVGLRVARIVVGDAVTAPHRRRREALRRAQRRAVSTPPGS